MTTRLKAQRAYALRASPPGIRRQDVLLETEWVLRRVYRLPPSAVLAGLRQIVGLPNTLMPLHNEALILQCPP